MKATKLLLITIIGILTLFLTVSCTEENILDSFEKEVSIFNDTSYTFNSLDPSIESINELSYQKNSSPILKLSDTENELIVFNELRLEVIDLHDQIVLERDKIKDSVQDSREIISVLKEKNYVLLEEDVTILRSNITELKTMRRNLLNTRGDAYQRLYDLRGTYTRDNLTDIISTYQEVIEVLKYRLETFKNANILLQDSKDLLNDYLES